MFLKQENIIIWLDIEFFLNCKNSKFGVTALLPHYLTTFTVFHFHTSLQREEEVYKCHIALLSSAQECINEKRR